ncbi:putative copper resistance protein D [Rudaeicoccus suwonensis]|uniref:Putative copper resistance protein D n=2 Tax=Rudaeicoccus suwonensis TaxID=657409 RepID=A0A561E6W6_9MICO|nr:putative copper resistance protein D [Rudaeicoccus suwonensis]
MIRAATYSRVMHPEPAAPARRVTTHPGWLTAALATGLVVCAATARFTGAVDPLQLLDPGVIVRWGIPLTTVAGELSMSLTIGLLLLGGFLVPETGTSARRMRTARYAAWSATAWAVTGVVGGILSYADVSGQHLGAPGFWSGAWSATWQLELLRAPAVSTLIAMIVAVCAYAAPRRSGQAWLCALAAFAILPLALVGHAAGSSDHDAAVNSLAFHLVGAAVWVGGLLALLVMWSRLGKGAPAVVARFSTVATWCFVAVGLSGVLNAWIRLGGADGLTSRYGAVVLAKIAALGILGGLGLQQRRRVVAALQRGGGAPVRALFVRFAGVEVVVMGVAIGLAAALARSAPPIPQTSVERADPALALTGYPTPPALHAMSWLTQWRVEWLFTAVAVVAVLVYLKWVLRLHRRGDRWPWTRTVVWCLGWVLFVYLVDGAPGVYGRVMFSAHMLGHMGISMMVPILLVRGAGVTLALRALPKRGDDTLGPREILLSVVHSRVFAVLANPVVASVLVLGTLVTFYYSPWFDFALRTHTGHVLMVTHFMVSGYIYAWALVGVDPGPRRWSPPARLLVLLVTICFHAFFGVALMTGTTVLAPDFFTTLHLPWVVSPLVDQQSAGTIAWGAGELPTLILAMLLAGEWYRRDRADGARAERQAERDGDAELRAYNDYLAARAKSVAGSSREKD